MEWLWDNLETILLVLVAVNQLVSDWLHEKKFKKLRNEIFELRLKQSSNCQYDGDSVSGL